MLAVAFPTNPAGENLFPQHNRQNREIKQCAEQAHGKTRQEVHQDGDTAGAAGRNPGRRRKAPHPYRIQKNTNHIQNNNRFCILFLHVRLYAASGRLPPYLLRIFSMRSTLPTL